MSALSSLIAALPVAPFVRLEIAARCDIFATDTDYRRDNAGETARQSVAAALIDIESMGENCGDFYDCPRGCLPADMRAARKEWRAIWRAARLLLAGDFYPEFCDHNSAMAKIDAQNLAR